MTPLRIFIGYDPKEALAYHVLAHSILRRASRPVSIAPLALSMLGALYTRPRDPRQSTDFTYTRFLVPYLSGYEGVSIFMDCDMLCLADLWTLPVDLADPLDYSDAVWCVQHDYTPRQVMKMDGVLQTAYPRKNWSSLMVFNNARCRALTPDYVNTATPAALHRFAWLRDGEIGALPLAWNYLVGEDHHTPAPPRLVHFTNGGPWFPRYEHVEYAEAWRVECEAMLGTVSVGALDGRR